MGDSSEAGDSAADRAEGSRASHSNVDPLTGGSKGTGSGLAFALRESRTWTGPLPPAEDFARFGTIVPTAPERILRMAEKAQEHAHRMDRMALEADIADLRAERAERRIGQVLGSLLACVALAAGAMTGGWYGGIIAALGASGLVGALLVHWKTASSGKVQNGSTRASRGESEPPEAFARGSRPPE